MFVVVTLAAAPMAWVGWQWRIVQERQRLRQEIEHAGGRFEPLTPLWLLVQTTSFHSILLPNEVHRNATFSQAEFDAQFQKRSYLPFPRKWLGDEPIGYIILPFPYSEPHVGPVQAAFPEAKIEPFRPEHH